MCECVQQYKVKPHNNQWDDEESSCHLKSEATEEGTGNWVKAVENERSQQRANVFDRSDECKQFPCRNQKVETKYLTFG